MSLPPTPQPTPCTEWSGARDKDGYGIAYRNGGYVRAHRWVWANAHGDIPTGMVVMHVCDNPPCINVEHLRIGTVADNNADRAAKGRTHRHNGWTGPRLTGERHSQAKLTEADVRRIRELLRSDRTQRSIAFEFGVCPATITLIKQRRTWKDAA